MRALSVNKNLIRAGITLVWTSGVVTAIQRLVAGLWGRTRIIGMHAAASRTARVCPVAVQAVVTGFRIIRMRALPVHHDLISTRVTIIRTWTRRAGIV
jgi:hypothetical protein